MRKTREVQPNLGFLQQLATVDNDLRKERYRKYNTLKRPIQYNDLRKERYRKYNTLER